MFFVFLEKLSLRTKSCWRITKIQVFFTFFWAVTKGRSRVKHFELFDIVSNSLFGGSQSEFNIWQDIRYDLVLWWIFSFIKFMRVRTTTKKFFVTSNLKQNSLWITFLSKQYYFTWENADFFAAILYLRPVMRLLVICCIPCLAP